MGSKRLRLSALGEEQVDVRVTRWQTDTVPQRNLKIETGPIGSLFDSILELLRLILIDIKSQPTKLKYYRSLESSSAALFFWGDDLGASRGELDEALQGSAQLRDTCLEVLVSIGRLVTSEFGLFLGPKTFERELLETTDILQTLEQANHMIDQQDYPTSRTQQDEEALCRSLRLKVDTLVMLGGSLASPASDNLDDEEPRALELIGEPNPEQAYVHSIVQRFPKAAEGVALHLGKLNWERYNHMLRLQRDSIKQEMQEAAKEKARTIFHDSALGNSLHTVPTHSLSEYAPSAASTRAESSHRRLPPLPQEARSGEPFLCPICKKKVRYKRTNAWKAHVFEDILAYACIFVDCSATGIFFESRELMMEHMEEHHGLNTSTADFTCPLCVEYKPDDREDLSLHFARHMEEIALAILPLGVDSDEESGEETESEEEFASQDFARKASHEERPSEEPHTPPVDIFPSSTEGVPQGQTQGKHVTFEALLPQNPAHRARLPMRVMIYPHDTLDAIITTVKNFYGLHERQGVIFEDKQGNPLILRFEDLCNDMLIYVREARVVDGARAHLCHFPDCERAVPGQGFPRRYNLFDHMKRVHQYDGTTTEPSPTPTGRTLRKPLSPRQKTSSSDIVEKHSGVRTPAASRGQDPPSPKDQNEQEEEEDRASDVQSDLDEDEVEPRYCYCNEVSDGNMIGCDNDDCPREWFHLVCVGLENPPDEGTRWFCSGQCKEEFLTKKAAKSVRVENFDQGSSQQKELRGSSVYDPSKPGSPTVGTKFRTSQGLSETEEAGDRPNTGAIPDVLMSQSAESSENKLEKLEKLIIAHKEEQLKREAATYAARIAENALADADTDAARIAAEKKKAAEDFQAFLEEEDGDAEFDLNDILRAEIRRLRSQSEMKDSRLRQVEQAVMALQRNHQEGVSEQTRAADAKLVETFLKQVGDRESAQRQAELASPREAEGAAGIFNNKTQKLEEVEELAELPRTRHRWEHVYDSSNDEEREIPRVPQHSDQEASGRLDTSKTQADAEGSRAHHTTIDDDQMLARNAYPRWDDLPKDYIDGQRAIGERAKEAERVAEGDNELDDDFEDEFEKHMMAFTEDSDTELSEEE